MSIRRIMLPYIMLLALALVAGSAGPAAASLEFAPQLCGSEFGGRVSGLAVKKDVFCNLERDWDWSILKSADQSDLTLATGEQFTVNYEVQVDADSTESFHVEGTIVVCNFSDAPIEITGGERRPGTGVLRSVVPLCPSGGRQDWMHV